jgi:hypothetical protein
MRRILSLAVAFASAVALTSPVEAKSDKNNGGGGKGNGKGGGGGAHVTQSAPRQQVRGGGNFARVNPGRPTQVHRYNAVQGQRKAPSVALTGRSRPESAAAQQHVATRGENWNERRKRIVDRLQAQQRYENRQERWEDRQDYWKDRREHWEDHHDHDYDWNDHHYYVPFSVHRYWDHNRIHYWNDNPYRWYNNAWVIVGPGYDYGYDYAPGVEYYSQGYSGGGSVVARVQDRLAREGYDPGPIDGALGGRTRDAIIDFQKDHDLPVTGRVDTPLLRELGL